jgi:hypothetical protein
LPWPPSFSYWPRHPSSPFWSRPSSCRRSKSQISIFDRHWLGTNTSVVWSAWPDRHTRFSTISRGGIAIRHPSAATACRGVRSRTDPIGVAVVPLDHFSPHFDGGDPLRNSHLPFRCVQLRLSRTVNRGPLRHAGPVTRFVVHFRTAP